MLKYYISYPVPLQGKNLPKLIFKIYKVKKVITKVIFENGL